MSSNGSISGISFSGISSGLDTTSIIQKLVSLDSAPISTYQSQLSVLQNQQNVYIQFAATLAAIGSAASSLTAPLAFNPVQANSSDTSVATLTGSSNATAGTYSLSVTQLAQAQKIASAAQSDTTSALNQSGTFVINGKVVQVSATDSLQKIAQSINGAGAGVTASLINGGTGNAYLTLSANSTGLSNQIQVADVTGSVLNNLGVISGTATPRTSIPAGVDSFGFSSKTQTLAQLLPNSGITTASFQVNGNTVNVDFSTDTLQTLATKITAAGVPSTVVTSTDASGKPSYKLEIDSAAGGNTFSDSQNVLQSLGVLQQSPASQLVQAQDANYKLDGVPLTSATNTVTSAIPGATLTLLKGSVATPGTSTLSLTKDTSSIVQSIQGFATAYNNAIDFVNQYSSFDTTSYQSGPLFGDPTAQQVVSGVSSLLFTNMPGGKPPYTNLASIGFSLDQNGDIQVDQTALTNAVNNSPDSLSSLFQSVGSTSGTGLTYITAGNNVKSGTYNIQVTAQPTFASYTAAATQQANTAGSETLTFNGALFGSGITVPIAQGSSQQQVIDTINNDASINTLIQASTDGNGHLKLTSLKQGALGNFSVISDQPDNSQAGDNSGIGITGTDGVAVKGADIQGTINGEPATGGPNGMLTGNTGNATTDGLQVQYTGSGTGFVGSVTVGQGVGASINKMITQFTDPVSGLLTTQENSITAQEKDINASITKLQADVANLTAQLQAEFNTMESAIAQLQQQGQEITATFNSITGSSSSSSTSTGKLH